MVSWTVKEGDVQYLSFYLKTKDPVSGSIEPYDLRNVDNIIFRMRKYGETINTIEINLTVVNPKDGYCRGLATIPSAGTYYSEVEVVEGNLRITWIGPIFKVVPELG